MGFGIFYVSAFIVYWVVDHYAGKRRQHLKLTNICPRPEIHPTDIVVPGGDLAISDTEAHRILSKRFPYYHSLGEEQKRYFVQRLQRFMQQKVFIIKDDEGFKEMPLLASASAIQLTFGLKDYFLPFYKYIRIYPTEYVSDDLLKVLAGNVHGNIITIAWNHLLKGYENGSDGSNTALHEMAHALDIQKMEVEKNYAKRFAKRYRELMTTCEGAFEKEAKGMVNLYSSYADKNLQEFWAESVELFFEKPAELQSLHPAVFEKMVLVLNQNPLRKENPVVQKSNVLSFFR